MASKAKRNSKNSNMPPYPPLEPVSRNIYFRGPTLLVVRGDKEVLKCDIDRVLIPDATRPLAGAAHPDGSPALAHYAGMTIIRQTTDANGAPTWIPIVVVPFRGKRVWIQDGSHMVCTGVNTDIERSVPVHELTNEGDNGEPTTLLPRAELKPGVVAADITFSGGTIGYGSENSGSTYCFPESSSNTKTRARRTPLLKIWEPAYAVEQDPYDPKVKHELSITVTDMTTHDEVVYYLRDGYSALIYNWDKGAPPVDTFRDLKTVDASDGPCEDIDFKWVYQLLHAPGGWDTFLSTNKLPAPIAGIISNSAKTVPTTGTDCGDGFFRLEYATPAVGIKS